MKTVTFLIIFLGCYNLYNSSEKAYSADNLAFQKWFQHTKPCPKITGLCFLLLGMFLAISLLGLSAGIITWIVATSLFLSLITLITPLRVVNYMFFTVLCMLTLLIEYFF